MLVPCADCGHEISTAATACPHCGRPNTTARAAGLRPAVRPVHGPQEGLALRTANRAVDVVRIGFGVVALLLFVGMIVVAVQEAFGPSPAERMRAEQESRDEAIERVNRALAPLACEGAKRKAAEARAFATKYAAGRDDMIRHGRSAEAADFAIANFARDADEAEAEAQAACKGIRTTE